MKLLVSTRMFATRCHTLRAMLIVALLLGMARTARADEDARVSETMSTVLVFAGTTASLPLMLGALSADGERARKTYGILAASTALIGPSLGRWYARDLAWGGLLARGLGMGLLYIPASLEGEGSPGLALYAPGLVLLAVGTIYDVYQTPRSVEKRNRVGVAPTVLVTPAQNAAAGLVVTGSF